MLSVRARAILVVVGGMARVARGILVVLLGSGSDSGSDRGSSSSSSSSTDGRRGRGLVDVCLGWHGHRGGRGRG